ncbi:unnamed protein product [Orchesella dallaii]|uniref:Uncharacterized protein n=1 Tax=Orchesella dallaii TaxID=48710 RepID=A0ABP1PMI7_9HEXA
MSTTTEGVDPTNPAWSKDKDGRKCYAVKVCIQKSPRPASKPRSTCQAGDGTLLLPPFDGQIRKIDCKSRGRRPSSNNSRRCGKYGIRETREFHTDTQGDQWECKSKCDKIARQCQTDTTANKSCQRKFAESHCQTINGEVKQCGLQTSALFTACSKECQTDVERACNAVGEPHNRKCCIKPCCKANRKLDTSNNTRYSHNREFNGGSNQMACERQHVFPFVGRTPSGNLKVHPNMISYEHREFGVLVANPNSIHTKVERLVGRCEKKSIPCPQVQLHSFPAPPSTPAPPPPCNCYPKEKKYRPVPEANAYHPDRQHPASFLIEDYATSSSPHPAPPFSRDDPSNLSDSPRENSKYHKRMLEPMKVDASNKTEDSYNMSQSEYGYTDEWNYVNPSYKKKQTESSRYEETDFSVRKAERYSEGTERSDRCSSDGVCHRSVKTNPFEEHLETDSHAWKEPNDMNGLHNYSHSEGSHKSGLSRRKPSHEKKSNNDARSPYTPPFPKDKKERMSDLEYRDVVESEATDDTKYNSSHEGSKANHHHHSKEKDSSNSKEMVGKLHYLLHGDIAQNTTIKIGETEYPIHSVIFEIQSNVMEPVKHHVPDAVLKNVILPDLNELPHKFVYDKNLTLGKVGSNKQFEHPTEYVKQHKPSKTMTIVEDTVAEQREEVKEQPAQQTWENVTVIEHDNEMESTNFSLKDPDLVETSFPSPVSVSPNSKDTVFRIVESHYNTPQHEPEPVLHIPSTETNLSAASKSEMREIPVPKPRKQHSASSNEERLSSVLLNLDTQRGAVLVVGGINPKLPCGPGNTGRDIFMYTIDANMWTHVGVLPHSRAHFGLARGSDPEQKDVKEKSLPVQSNLRLNLRTGEWDALSELERPRSHFGCVALKRNIFVIGGNVEAM